VPIESILGSQPFPEALIREPCQGGRPPRLLLVFLFLNCVRRIAARTLNHGQTAIYDPYTRIRVYPLLLHRALALFVPLISLPVPHANNAPDDADITYKDPSNTSLSLCTSCNRPADEYAASDEIVLLLDLLLLKPEVYRHLLRNKIRSGWQLVAETGRLAAVVVGVDASSSLSPFFSLVPSGF
jgi:hypothetical protein